MPKQKRQKIRQRWRCMQDMSDSVGEHGETDGSGMKVDRESECV